MQQAQGMVPPQCHQPPAESTQPTSSDEVRTLWIGDLQYWMDENYIASCFPQTVEVLSIKLIRNKRTQRSEGYGFIEFAKHADAARILQTYNGSLMPSVKQNIKLNWAYYGAGERRDDALDRTRSTRIGPAANKKTGIGNGAALHPPSDPTVKNVADKPASFVAKHGRSFEHVTRNKNPGDTPFKALSDENCVDYKPYEYPLHEEKKLLQEAKEYPTSESGGSTSNMELHSKDQAPASASPVILRWQDLGELPKGEIIFKAVEDYIPLHVKEKRKEKEKRKGKGNKGKGNKGKENKGEEKLPPLANYIKLSEWAYPCKMCPNRDGHTTVHCPNLTPELKETLKVARSRPQIVRRHSVDMGCNICLKKDHWSSACSYRYEYPAGAVVGRYAAIICFCCGMEKPHPGVPGLDWDARVVLKYAYPYPSIDEELMELKLASEGATAGTGNNAST